MIKIKVPEFGESITEATLLAWFKREGDYVVEDEVLIELETDKVTTEILASDSGIIKKIYCNEGATVKVNDLLLEIDETASKPKQNITTSPPDTKNKIEHQSKVEHTLPPSPAASKMLQEKKISSADVSGTGRHHQVTKQDVIQHVQQNAIPQQINGIHNQENISSQKEKISQPLETRIPMTKIRQIISKRLVEVQQTSAILTTFNEINVKPVLDIRKKYNDLFLKKYNTKLGLMSFFVKASIDALKLFPAINAEIDGTDIIYKNYYHVGVAVGGPKGLVVPVIKDADELSLIEIEIEIKKFVEKIQNKTIQLSELNGGTFTISNGGVYGSMLSTPILNPPQTGILGMHNIVNRPVVEDNEIVIRPIMYLALSYDHRMVDGKTAVQFLVRIKECIEDPSRLMLGV